MPVCPPSWKLAQRRYVAMAKHLRAHNWSWCDSMLLTVVAHLAAEGIADATALYSVELADVDGAANWPRDVWNFMHRLTLVGPSACFVPQRVVPPVLKGPGSLKRALELTAAPSLVIDVSGAKPLAALALLEASMPADPEQRAAWRGKARVAAVLGSCPKSLASFKSGVKHWTKYIMITHGSSAAERVAFPPRLEDVLAWSNTFRSAFAHLFGLAPVALLFLQGVSGRLPIILAIFGLHATQWVSKRHLWGTQPFGAPCALLQSANFSSRVQKCSFRGALLCVRCCVAYCRCVAGPLSATWSGQCSVEWKTAVTACCGFSHTHSSCECLRRYALSCLCKLRLLCLLLQGFTHLQMQTRLADGSW